MLIDYMGMLRKFHYKYEHVAYDEPTALGNRTLKLRKKLIKEETAELYRAMNNGFLPDIAKELADVLYVVFGTAVSYGLPMDDIFNAVHQANMTKSPVKNLFGKTKKGNDYKAPDVEGLLSAIARKEGDKEKA